MGWVRLKCGVGGVEIWGGWVLKCGVGEVEVWGGWG